MAHPLHLAYADENQRRLGSRFELVRDPACGGNHQLPLFVGQHICESDDQINIKNKS